VVLLPAVGAVDERIVKDQLCALVRDLHLPPRLDLALQRLEVPLNPVHADRECINQVEALGVLGQDRSEHACNNVTISCDASISGRSLASSSVLSTILGLTFLA